MNILENISLKPYNTFGIDVKARFFLTIESVLQLQKALQLAAYPKKFILSGGSNMLLTKDLDVLVMRLAIMGISVEEKTQDYVIVKAMAGENWHELVLWSLENNYGGLENLSLIPGCVGTSPIQNIGAYGVELADVFHSCEAMNVETQELRGFSKEECKFGYRDSVFKNDLKGKYIITSVSLKLTVQDHRLHTHYGAIESELAKMEIVHPSIQDISRAVIQIRQEKLPDPKEIGNSGSFFKNPVLNKKQFEKFLKKFSDAPHYALPDGSYKVPAGWLIEQTGYKGKRMGDAGVHEKQALVLVNHGKASGEDILTLSHLIQKAVKAMFAIDLETEVNIIK